MASEQQGAVKTTYEYYDENAGASAGLLRKIKRNDGWNQEYFYTDNGQTVKEAWGIRDRTLV